MHFRSPLLLLFGLTFLVAACQNDSNPEPDPCDPGFDQTAFFTHVADSLILPAYEALLASVETMDQAGTDFLATPTTETLSTLRAVTLSAWLDWQQAAPYNFGPAETVYLHSSVNNFPLNLDELLQNIETGTYDFDQPAAYDKGFPALDYLLFGTGATPEAVVEQFATAGNSAAYRQYLADVISDIRQRIEQTRSEWGSGYRNDFIENTGTAAGRSLSLLINHFNQHFEGIKREQIGIPSGVLTLGFPNPDRVEAFYSEYSLELAQAALAASIDLYTGKDGLGLDDYLNQAEAKKNGLSLDEVIRAQFATAADALAAIPGPLSQAVEEAPTEVTTAYAELAKQVVLIKTDLPSVLCVSITYIDNPSDSD